VWLHFKDNLVVARDRGLDVFEVCGDSFDLTWGVSRFILA